MNRKVVSFILAVCLSSISLFSIEYEEYFNNGKINELRKKIYTKPRLSEDELPRAAYYESLISNKNFEAAMTELIEYFPQIEYRDKIHFKLGVINFFKRNYSKAELYFLKIENKEKVYEYNYWMARLYFMKQEFSKSEKYANKFLKESDKKDHKYDLSYYMLIEGNVQQAKYKEAIVHIEQLLKNDKEGLNKAYLYYNLGLSYERSGEIKKAVSNYKKSFMIDQYSQYAALAEEHVFEIRKYSKENIDYSWLYAKQNRDEIKDSSVKKYTTSAKDFDLTNIVRTDTLSILNSYISESNTEGNVGSIVQEIQPIDTDTLAVNEQALYDPEDGEFLDRLTPVEDNKPELDIDIFNEDNSSKNEGTEVDSNNDKGELLDRPINVEPNNYIVMMNKPVGKYFIQVGRFSNQERAIDYAKNLYVYQIMWNVVRDINESTGKTTYVVWGGPYSQAKEAKDNIDNLKNDGVECFLKKND